MDRVDRGLGTRARADDVDVATLGIVHVAASSGRVRDHQSVRVDCDIAHRRSGNVVSDVERRRYPVVPLQRTLGAAHALVVTVAQRDVLHEHRDAPVARVGDVDPIGDVNAPTRETLEGPQVARLPRVGARLPLTGGCHRRRRHVAPEQHLPANHREGEREHDQQDGEDTHHPPHETSETPTSFFVVIFVDRWHEHLCSYRALNAVDTQKIYSTERAKRLSKIP